MKGERAGFGCPAVTRRFFVSLRFFFAAALWLFTFSASVLAHVTDCKGSSPDGQAICTEPLFTDFTYGICRSYPPSIAAWKVWCVVQGGTVVEEPRQHCEGDQPVTDGNIYTFSEAFASWGGVCNIEGVDKGWLGHGERINPPDPFCWDFVPEYVNGQNVHSLRELRFTGTRGSSCDNELKERFIARRDRKAYCPPGYTGRSLESGVDSRMECYKFKVEECTAGNPVTVTSLAKIQKETDYASAQAGLSFSRTYNSQSYLLPLGSANHPTTSGTDFWTHSFDKRVYDISSDSALANVRRSNGEILSFNPDGSPSNATRKEKLDRLEKLAAGGWRYTRADGSQENYDSNGRLIAETTPAGQITQLTYNAQNQLSAVTGPSGHQLTFTWDTEGRLATMMDPAGGSYVYSYDANGNPISVRYPDGAERHYHYEVSYHNDSSTSSNRYLLTGITDENGDRFATFEYDTDLYKHAKVTRHAQTDNGAPQEKLTFRGFRNSYGRWMAGSYYIDSVGTKTAFSNTLVAGVVRPLQIWVYGDTTVTRSFIHDTAGNITNRRDENNRNSTYTWNATNQKTSMTEAAGTPQARTTTYEYLSPTLDRVTRETSPGVSAGHQKQTVTVYDPNILKPLSITQSGFRPDGAPVSRTTTFQYDAFGHVMQIDGPRTDVADITSYTWYNCNTGGRCGQLASVTNALGQTTTYDSYDANANLLQSTDPNGIVTNLTYDARNRLLSITRTPPAGQGSARVTSYTYDKVGQMTSVALPDGVSLAYSYDAAHYLRSITDNLGNRVEYHYDLKGNRDREDIRDPQGKLVRSIRTAHDLRDRVSQITDAGNTSVIDHDAVGNTVSETDPNNNPATTHEYNALDQLVKTTDSIGGETRYEYDPAGRVSRITSPINAETVYQYDDLGNLLQETSPDRGTISYVHDAAGNVTSVTDARGVTTSYIYDALNRLVGVNPPGAAEDIVWAHDNCANGIGRICNVQDESGTTVYSYDPWGNISAIQKTEAGIVYHTHYSHDAGNRLTGLVYPDGRQLQYTRDALGRISAIHTSIEGQTSAIVTGIRYRADQQLARQTFGNGVTEQRRYGPAGQLLSQQLGSLDTRRYAWDKNRNLLSQTSSSQLAQYQYDALNRLNDIRYWLDQPDPDLPPGSTQTINSQYSPASNRMTQRDNQAVQLDPAGNTLSDHGGQRAFQYNQRGRLWKLFGNGQLKAQYTYNASGQRTRKTLADGTETVYHYDSQGRLIAETSQTGQPLRDYIWADDRPVAQIETHRDAAGKLHNDNIIYLFSDHLNTPRIGMDQASQIIWRNDSVGFGEQAANDDPDGDSNATVVNLRFPGQYFDGESGLHYNYNRYYDPETGRYITSDPIGLDGGINTYLYAKVNPLVFNDPTGESATAVAEICIRFPSLCGVGARAGGALGGFLGAIGGLLYPSSLCENEDECIKEWKEAERICRDLIMEELEQRAGRRRRRSVRGVTGGFTNVRECARGLVSQKCGGNRVN